MKDLAFEKFAEGCQYRFDNGIEMDCLREDNLCHENLCPLIAQARRNDRHRIVKVKGTIKTSFTCSDCDAEYSVKGNILNELYTCPNCNRRLHIRCGF